MMATALYAPVPGLDRVKRDFGDQARRTSVYNWLEMHPGTRFALAGSALAAVGWLAGRRLRA